MRRILAEWLLSAFLALALLAPASAQAQIGWSQVPGGANSFAVTSTGASLKYPANGPLVIVTNAGTTQVYVRQGDASAQAATTDLALPAGRATVFAVGANTFIAAITDSGNSSTISVSVGSGTPIMAGGVGSAGGGVGACAVSTALLYNNASALGCDAGLTYAPNGRVTITNSTANTTPLTITGGSHTSATAANDLSITTTLNSSSYAGDVIALHATNTASAAGATLLNLYGGAGGLTSEFSVDPSGNLSATGFISSNVFRANGAGLTFKNSASTTIASIGSSGGASFPVVAPNTAELILSGGSTTGSSTVIPGVSVTGTLNTTGIVDGAALSANITNTASGAGSKLADIQVASSSVFNIDMSGDLTLPSGYLLFNTNLFLSRVSTGTLQIGSTSSNSLGAIKMANWQAGILYSIAGTALPTCSGVAGAYATVSDATSATPGGAYSGSGSNNVAVHCNGTNWIILGEIANDNMKDAA